MRFPARLLLLIWALLLAMPIMAQDEDSDRGNSQAEDILTMLAYLPDDGSLERTSGYHMLSYIDYAALRATVPGEVPSSYAELYTDENSELRSQYFDYVLGRVIAGPIVWLSDVVYPFNMPYTHGFDLFDVDAAAASAFGDTQVTVLRGEDFDPDAIQLAMALSQYDQSGTAVTVSGTLYCAPTGCLEGFDTPITADEHFAFLTTEPNMQPILEDVPYVIGLNNEAGFEAYQTGFAGQSFADRSDIQALVEAIAAYPANLLQVHFVGRAAQRQIDLSTGDFSPYRMEFGIKQGDEEEEIPPIMAFLRQYGELPQFKVGALADYDHGETQEFVVMLAYDTESDALAAADVLPQRFDAFPDSLRVNAERVWDHNGLAQAEIAPVQVQQATTGEYLVVLPMRYPMYSGDAQIGSVYSFMVALRYLNMGRFYPLWQFILPPEE